jgi:hypothetical protein
MLELIDHLNKRRIIVMIIVVLLAIIAITVSYNFQITPSTYFGGKYNSIFIYSLIIYKIIELLILYYLLFHRHFSYLRNKTNHEDFLPKLRKHLKLLFFLVPQGNTIFGIIAYKLSGNVAYFLLFSCIALITLYLIKPNNLNVTAGE